VIEFADQAALDEYVRRVIAAFLDQNERASREAVSRTMKESYAPSAVLAINRVVSLVNVINRGALMLPLPVVER
jgi:hypothetical protein